MSIEMERNIIMKFIVPFVCICAAAFGLCLAGVGFDRWLMRKR